MKAIMFTLPDSVQVPDGKGPGDSFQAMATFQLKPNGKACLTEVDGEPLDGYKSESETPNDEANDDTTQPAAWRSQLMGGQ